ncbi:DUF3152 domain-containing protein [Actinoplanes sp. NEAU-A12]|uniref:DUF3152 domain-containing protein n=1 Tax=Actinoplanes sandaracinus TaxID=3045177 RepID=A0ABT6WG03_9ACTN|nr:DUF3152 domain-containing protein [Actinoplanes sandaracinus]MDI6098630.1 DUF3152 domain-containing protein [Actinoplanes sandaracinus]
MANATNGPLDPNADIDRRGRAERSRAEAAPPAPAGTPASASSRRRTVPATSTTGRTPVTAPAEPARKTVRTSAATEKPTRAAAARKPVTENAGPPVKPAAAVKSTSSRATTGRSPARKTATAKAPVEAPADQPEETAPPRPARRRSAAATPAPEPVDREPVRRATRPAAEPAAETARPAGRTPRTGPATASRGITPDTQTRGRRPARTALDGPAGADRPALTAGGPEQPGPSLPPPEMTRGILELAAERLAASTRLAEPEPRPLADGDPMAAPGSYVNPRATGSRRASRTVPGSARPPAGPVEGARPPDADVERWDGASAENGWLGLPGAPERPGRGDETAHIAGSDVRRAATVSEPLPDSLDAGRTDPRPAGSVGGAGLDDQYPRTMNRPAIGLPASVRLPAELPDNLWPPKHMLERNLTENIYVPAAVPFRTEDADAVAEAEQAVDERVYVPPAPSSPERHRSAVEVFREDEHEDEPEPDFLPSVLSREDDESEYVPSHSRSTSSARHAAAETVTARRTRRRRRAMLLTYLLAVVLVLVVGRELRGDEQPLAPGREAAQRAAEPAGVGPAAAPEPAAPMKAEPAEPGAVEAPGVAEAGEFGYARSRGPMLGSAGRLYRFRVAVEKVVEDTSPGEFAEKIDETLGDGRSWTNDGRLRLRRMPKAGADVDFTIYLASAKTSEQMCAAGGLNTEGFTSCRLPEKVIINADRWAGAVPDYEGRIGEYRQYTINHEVGHELGHGHEACPGEGEKAPVMMQQTFGLKGCTPNAWPYLDGKRYAGKPIA